MYNSNLATASLYTMAIIGFLLASQLIIPIIGYALITMTPFACLWCIVYLMVVHKKEKIKNIKDKDLIDQ